MTKKRFISFITVLSLILSFIVLPANAVSPYAVVLPDPDQGGGTDYSGTYFIKNCHFDRFITIDDNVSDSTSSAHMELWSLSGGNDQKWQISYVSDGYYKIISVASGFALSVPVGYAYTGGADVQQETYTGATRQLWSITLTDNNTFVLRPKSGLNDSTGTDWCLCVSGSSGDGDGRNVEQWGYSDNSVYIDEWLLVENATMYVNNYIDQGFEKRFNYLNVNPSSLVSSYNSIVANRFMSIFGLVLVPQCYAFTSTPDSCKISVSGSVNSSNISNACSHTTSHLNTIQLRNDLSDGTSTASIVIWTGHIMDQNERSDSSLQRQSVVITPWLTSTLTSYNDVERENVFTLIHELSHQIGAPDHYCYGKQNGALSCTNPDCDVCSVGLTATRVCLMSNRMDISTVSDADLYCSDCINTIRAHLYDHHYGG